ncbi:uncharacterized protein gprin3a [Nerophis ophidion]|uniref:uncharacterized protein gprin3a n=1 Tax=Nerophis ophidion TaxID=159077 RepID=UPI002AE09748|nr:uncharacterized protein gprin3a [Nerophis ophidion]XP_061769369.1 uncharacterized protein gprin3a [Nerophis ophidion]
METSYNSERRKDIVKSQQQTTGQAGFVNSLGQNDANAQTGEEPNFNLNLSVTSLNDPRSQKDDGKLAARRSQEGRKPKVSLMNMKESESHRVQKFVRSPRERDKTRTLRVDASGALKPTPQSETPVRTTSHYTPSLKMQSIKKQDPMVQDHREDSGYHLGKTVPDIEEAEPASHTVSSTSVNPKPQMEKMQSILVGNNNPKLFQLTLNSEITIAPKVSLESKRAPKNSCGSKGSSAQKTGYSFKMRSNVYPKSGSRKSLDCKTDSVSCDMLAKENSSLKSSPGPEPNSDSFKTEPTSPPSIMVLPSPVLASRCNSPCSTPVPLAASSPKTRACVAVTTHGECPQEPEYVANLTKGLLTFDMVDMSSLKRGVALKKGQWKATVAGGTVPSQDAKQWLVEAGGSPGSNGRPPQHKVGQLRDDNVNILLSQPFQSPSAHPERLNFSEMPRPRASERREVGVQAEVRVTEHSVSTSPSLLRGAPSFSLIGSPSCQSYSLTSPTVSLCCVPAVQPLRKHVCKIDIELCSQFKEGNANSIKGGDEEVKNVRVQAGEEVGATPREVAKDEQGMTWEVYGASVNLESQSTAIQSHLESKIQKQAKHIRSLRRFIRKHNWRKKQKSKKKKRKRVGRTLRCCCTAPLVQD